MFTFKNFLGIINEDANLDKMIMDIQAAIGQLDTKINQQTQPLLNQKAQLQRRLGPLLKNKQMEDKKTNAQNQQANQQANQQSSNQTTTPGGTSNATPGGAPNGSTINTGM